MELILKVLALDDAQIGILELSDDRLEDGRDEGATEVAIKTIGIYLEGSFVFGCAPTSLRFPSLSVTKVPRFLMIISVALIVFPFQFQ